ncbi:hypothetical protein BLA18628_07209 [Burkholderia aenigmatica]|uniref:hypothetical protein n=1 Tax=Burkholderia aenigmatica TaxID=2015348 RepID=UPI00145347D9|nr:hypothetical protein [Burkholderia aenigmatica]VWD60962.1 hypothetical protein BLA18628_07209 [Burkholderia aenigmatica]
MSTITNANMPNPGTPVVGPDGRLASEWFAFFLSLLSRTGGQGTPIDIVNLQKQVAGHAAEIGELFVLENSITASALLGALMARIAVLEMALQSVVAVSASAKGSGGAQSALPEPVAVPARAAQQLLPDQVPARAKDPTTDIYKMVSK